MDPNEATQKLLLQDPFHEVKRKRDRKKEAVKKIESELKKDPDPVGESPGENGSNQ